MAHKLASTFVRLFQLIFAIIILGLSIAAVRWQYRNDVPATNGYSCFAGAFACLAAFIGFIALLIDPITGAFMLCLDVLATIFLLAGGIAMAVGLGGVDCGNPDASGTWFNKLISGGCIWDGDENLWHCSYHADSDLVHRCHMAEADTAFMFICFLVSFIAAVLDILVMHSKKKILHPRA